MKIIRKILAGLVLFIFVAVAPVLIFLQAIVSGFFDENRLINKVIPGSYGPITNVLADQASDTPADEKLFNQRIKSIISEKSYVDLFGSAVSSVFEEIKQWKPNSELSLNLLSIKEKLNKIAPEVIQKVPPCSPSERASKSFRFCKPSGVSNESLTREIKDAVLKGIPESVKLVDLRSNPDASRIFNIVMLIKKYFSKFVILIPLVLLALMGLLIFSPCSNVLRAVGKALICLAVTIALVVVALDRLPETVSLIQKTAPSQQELVAFLFKQPNDILKMWAYYIGISGVLIYGGGLLLKYKYKT